MEVGDNLPCVISVMTHLPVQYWYLNIIGILGLCHKLILIIIIIIVSDVQMQLQTTFCSI